MRCGCQDGFGWASRRSAEAAGHRGVVGLPGEREREIGIQDE